MFFFLYLTPLLLFSHTNGSLFLSSLTVTTAHGEKREARSRKNLFMREEERGTLKFRKLCHAGSKKHQYDWHGHMVHHLTSLGA
jgi:hypothetical protein